MMDQFNVQRLFNYIPETGELLWKDGSGRRIIGMPVPKKVRLRDGKTYLRHRLIWLYVTGFWPSEQLDHVNGNHQDDRWSNLREASPTENQHNKIGFGKYSKGVVFKGEVSRSKPWAARIRVNGVREYLGSFATHDEAADAYAHRAIQAHGDFANF